MNFIRKKCITIFSSILCCVAANQSYAVPESYAAQQSAPEKQTVANTADKTADTSTPATTNDPNAPAQTAAEEQPEVKDPHEGFNRAMFTFNEKLDKFVLKPIATVYNAIMPKPLNEGVHNFFLNIGNLPNIANDILQFNFYQMASDTWRLGINTTIGIGGLFDVAGRIGLKPYANDFGLTLATWGYKNSNYLVLPFFGPNTIRDALGIPVDYYGFSIYPHIRSWKARYEIYGLSVIDRRAQLLQYQEVFEEVSLDKYIFVRNAYMQRRAYQIEQNQHLGHADQLSQNTTLPNPPPASVNLQENSDIEIK